MKDYFLLAFRNLSHRRLRSLLTIIGIFIGIATVVALLSLGDGLQGAISGEFQKLGSDKLTVMGSNGFASSPFVSASTAKPLDSDDLRAIQKIPGIASAGGMLYKSSDVTYKRESRPTFAIGMPLDEDREALDETSFAEIQSGRALRQGDRGKATVGHAFADDLFDRPVALGDSLVVSGRSFEVIGIYASTGNAFDDNAVYMDLEEVRTLFDEPKLLSLMLAKVQPGEDIAAVAEAVREKLRKLKDQEEGSETFSVSTPEQLAASFGQIFGVVQFVLVGIAAISLLVGGIGIMNTMYTAILERTKEIGILKAVGAKQRDILALFLIESGLLGLLGGIVGVLVGAALSKGAEIAIRSSGYAAFSSALSLQLIVGALVFSFLVGAVSGVMPARSAAAMNPADAIRYE